KIKNANAVTTSTPTTSVVRIGNSAPTHKLRISEMKNTASNANSAGWISNGFDKRTMPCEDFPGQKELLNPFKRDGRTISPDPDLGGCSILSRVYAGMMPPLRTLKIANSAILSYNPRNLLEKRFQTRNRITYHDLQKKIFLGKKEPFFGSLNKRLFTCGRARFLSVLPDR